MQKKHFARLLFLLFFIPVLTLQFYVSAQAPELYYSFENGFNRETGTDYPLISYGHMSFSETGAKNKSLNLHNGYLAIKDSENLRLKRTFTFAAWFNFNELTANTPMLLSRTASSGDPFNGPLSIRFSDNYEYLHTDLTFKMPNNAYQSYSFASGYVFTPKQLVKGWHHVAVVFSETYLSYYIDGVLTSTEMLPQYLQNYESIANTRQPFYLGRGVNSDINAAIDEVYFYNRALSYDEVHAIYTNARPQTRTEIILTEGYNTVWVNDVCYTAPANTVYNAEADEVMIPAKAVLQHMGASIYWDGTDGFGRADITCGNNTVSLWVYDTNAVVNGNYYKLKCHPDTYEDALFIPASLLKDGFGADLEWNETFRQLTVTF